MYNQHTNHKGEEMNTQTKQGHTPGPWAYGDYSEFKHPVKTKGYFIIPQGQNWRIAEMLSLENTEANARLIAAAPELLAALKAICDDNSTIVKYICEGSYKPNISRLIDRGKQAIAKAQGK